MLKRTLQMGAVLALWAAVIAARPVQAQPAPGTNAPAATGHVYRAKQVIGSKVHIQGDVSIGVVEDIVFDDAGYVEYLIVANEGRLVSVPWQAAKFNFETRTATVNITQERFRDVPTYTVERYPNFYAPAYRTETYRYYGLTPRERRIERRETRP